MKKHSGFSVVELLIIIVIVGLVGAVGWLVYDRQKSKDDNVEQVTQTTQQEQKQEAENQAEEDGTSTTLDKGNFGDDGEYGSFDALGYAMCDEECKDGSYVFFRITETENDKIDDFIKNHKGNSFVREDAIGIGCYSDGQILYYNESDSGIKNYKFSKEDTSTIMESTNENPAVLSFEKLKYLGGRGALDCYSHFTTISVVD